MRRRRMDATNPVWLNAFVWGVCAGLGLAILVVALVGVAMVG